METDSTSDWNLERAGVWAGVFLLNLIVPLPLGLLAASSHLGIFAAIVVLLAGSFVLCGWFPRLGHVLIQGGIVMAFSQIFPILQIGSGILAILTWEGLFGTIRTDLSSFFITLMTAFPLLLAAFVFGGGHRLLFGTSEEDAATLSEPLPEPPE